MARNRFPGDDEDYSDGDNRLRQLLVIGLALLVVAVVGLIAVIGFGIGNPAPEVTPTPAPSLDDGVGEVRNATPVLTTTVSTPLLLGAGGNYRGDWYQLLFNAPVYPDNPQQRPPSLDTALVNFMNQAKRTIDVAVYDFDLANVADAMVRAKQRGIRVRMVTDSDTLNNPKKDPNIAAAIDRLRKAEIVIVDDQRSALMQHKFTVVDNERIATGSWNYTEGDSFRFNNNLIVINLPQIAQNYTAEFEKMFTKKQFGAKKESGVPFPILTVGNSRIENYFAPQDGIARKIADKVRGAQSSVNFLAYAFTQNEIGQAMLDRAKAGVKIGGVFEANNIGSQYSYFGKLQAAQSPNIEVYPDVNPFILQEKVIIIDNRIVIFGSYNFSDNSDKNNDENVLIIDDANLAKAFKEEYDRIVALSKGTSGTTPAASAPAGTPKP